MLHYQTTYLTWLAVYIVLFFVYVCLSARSSVRLQKYLCLSHISYHVTCRNARFFSIINIHNQVMHKQLDPRNKNQNFEKNTLFKSVICPSQVSATKDCRNVITFCGVSDKNLFFLLMSYFCRGLYTSLLLLSLVSMPILRFALFRDYKGWSKEQFVFF